MERNFMKIFYVFLLYLIPQFVTPVLESTEIPPNTENILTRNFIYYKGQRESENVNVLFNLQLTNLYGEVIYIICKKKELSYYQLLLNIYYDKEGNPFLIVDKDIIVNRSDIFMKNIYKIDLLKTLKTFNITLGDNGHTMVVNNNKKIPLKTIIYKKNEVYYSNDISTQEEGAVLIYFYMKKNITKSELKCFISEIKVDNVPAELKSNVSNISVNCDNGQGKDNISTTTSNTINRNSQKSYKTTPPTPTECRLYIWIIATCALSFLISSIFWIIFFKRNAIKDKFQRKREKTIMDCDYEHVYQVKYAIISLLNGFYDRIKRAFKRGNGTSSGSNSRVSSEGTPDNVSIDMSSDVHGQVVDDIISDPNRDQSDSPPTTQNI